MDDLYIQLRILSCTLAAGLVLGLTFDAYRILRGMARPGKLIAGIGDLAFWLIVTAIVSAALVFGNYGELRSGAFIGIALGLLIYRKALSRRIIASATVGIRIFVNVLSLIGHLFRWPVTAIVGVRKLILQFFYYSRPRNRRKS